MYQRIPSGVLLVWETMTSHTVQAIAVARKFLAGDDKDILCQPAFREGCSSLNPILRILMYVCHFHRVAPQAFAFA